MQETLKFVNTDKTLKKIGFTFSKNGIHTKLNEILKHIDLQLKIANSERIMIDGVRNRKYTYEMI